jgi:hypothetical protein
LIWSGSPIFAKTGPLKHEGLCRGGSDRPGRERRPSRFPRRRARAMDNRGRISSIIGSISPLRGRNAHDGYFDHTRLDCRPSSPPSGNLLRKVSEARDIIEARCNLTRHLLARPSRLKFRGDARDDWLLVNVVTCYRSCMDVLLGLLAASGAVTLISLVVLLLALAAIRSLGDGALTG